MFQAPLLKKYPANISLTAYSYLFGTIFMGVTAFFTTNLSTDWKFTQSEVIAVCYAVSLSFLPFSIDLPESSGIKLVFMSMLIFNI